jgi:thioredoxin reductase (NADPH)
MDKPVLLAVDDDRQVLAAVRRDLQARYARDYRVVASDGGPAALDATRELHRRGDEVALFLVDQRMPALSGTEFLLEARQHYPHARKVLLTAYADTEAAIQSINEVGLDHYLMKPWDPPEESLYPVLDDLLDDWNAGRPARADGIRVVGARWDAATHDVKDFLVRNQVPYRFLDVERDPEASALLDAAAGETEPRLPIVFLPDGETLVQPGASELAGHVGLQSQASQPFYDLVIVGAGPAGLAGAVYGASEGLRVAVLERQAPGGQAGTSSRIENYLGFPNGISGADLARRAAAQAKRLGAELLSPVEVSSVRAEGPARVTTLADGRELTSHAVLVASGMKVRKLDVPGVERLTGAGVYYGATFADAASYRGEPVLLIGGANSAGQAAMMFSRYAEQVTLLVRGPSIALRMSRYLVDQVEATDNIRVLTGSQVREVRGSDRLEEVVIERRDGGELTEKAAGLFVFVGAVPHTDFLDGVVARNRQGFLRVGPDLADPGRKPRGWPLDRDPYLLETSVPGIFAAGDVCEGTVQRVASAVGQGSMCISLVHRYLTTV